MDPEIPEILEQYRGPATATQSIVALIIRGFRVLFVQSPTPHVPRESVAPMEDLVEKLKKLIETASTPGELEYKIPHIHPFTWHADGRKTDYFFIDGSNFKEKDGYEWQSLIKFGIDETLKRDESAAVFSQLYSAYSRLSGKD